MLKTATAPFLFFVSGILASAGVNLLTSLAGASFARPWVIVAWALQWLCASAALAVAASYLDRGSREALLADRQELSMLERRAIQKQIEQPYIKQSRRAACIGAVLIFVAVGFTFMARSATVVQSPRLSDTATTHLPSRMRVIIIHGALGSPNENWFPWLASQLRKRGVRVDVPAFPTPEGESLASWRAAFAEQIGSPTDNMVLVGHSLGPAFIVRMLETSPSRVSGVFLVAPFIGPIGNEQFDALNKTFLVDPVDWSRVRASAGFVRVYGSDNDPYVPRAMTNDVAAHLGVHTVVVHGAGHFNTASGYSTFPLLLNDIVSFLESKGALIDN